MKLRLLALCASLAALAGCRSTSADDPLPPPFDAQEIRSAHPSGTELVFRRVDADGSSLLQVMRFVEADAEGVTVEAWLEDDQGRALTAPARSPRTSWAELRDHARFDPARAVRKRVSTSFPSGPFEGWLYTVLGDGGLVERYYFDDDRPGPPERFETTRDGERIALMEFVERR